MSGSSTGFFQKKENFIGQDWVAIADLAAWSCFSATNAGSARFHTSSTHSWKSVVLTSRLYSCFCERISTCTRRNDHVRSTSSCNCWTSASRLGHMVTSASSYYLFLHVLRSHVGRASWPTSSSRRPSQTGERSQNAGCHHPLAVFFHAGAAGVQCSASGYFGADQEY